METFPGLMFGLAAFLFTLKFLENYKIYNLLIAGISIAIAYILKSNYEIFALAIFIILGLNFLQNYKKQSIAGIVLIIFCMFSLKFFVYHHVETGTGYSLSEGNPMLSYVYMGIAEPVTLTPGWYTADVENIYNESNYNKEKATEITKKLLQERINFFVHNPKYAFEFFSSKLQTTWLNPTFQTLWCSTPSVMLDLDPVYNSKIQSKPIIDNILCGNISTIFERIMDVFQIITFTSAGISLFLIFKKGDLKKTLLAITFLGGFLFHTIWETKAIYVIQYFYIIIPFSAYGLYLLFKFIDNKIDQAKQ